MPREEEGEQIAPANITRVERVCNAAAVAGGEGRHYTAYYLYTDFGDCCNVRTYAQPRR